MSITKNTPYKKNLPIISICIPTFNRASCLENILKNLQVIKKQHGSNLEICLSDNNSTDNTSQVIKNWTNLLEFNYVTQTTNIGATLNFLAVTKIASGKWIMIVGDNDELIPENFTKLINHIITKNTEDWILTGVADGMGNERLLGKRKDGRYDANAFRKLTLRTDLNGFGFIGMHIFPSVLKQHFISLTYEQAQPWPHLALFFRHIQQGGHVQILTTPVVQQSGGGEVLFWSIQAMTYITLRKLNVIAEARTTSDHCKWFLDVLLLRELYSLRNARTLAFLKALEPKDFYKNGFKEYIKRYSLIRKPYIYLISFHFLYLIAVYITPSYLMYFFLLLAGQKKSMRFYNKSQIIVMGEFDGIKRGL